MTREVFKRKVPFLCHFRQVKGTAYGWSHLHKPLKNMSFPVIDKGKIRKSDDLALADKAIMLRKTKGVWDVVEFLISAWADRSPDEFKAFKVYLKDTRDAQIDKEFGQTKNKDMDRRLVLVFPEYLQRMLRVLYTAEELKMDRKFFQEFASRFPAFRIPEKT